MGEIYRIDGQKPTNVEGGGEPPRNDELEKRVSKLEDQHTAIMVSLARIEARLDAVDQKVDRLPDKFWTGRLMILTIAATFALLLTANKLLELMGGVQ